MPLKLYAHPFSSYCQKVLIALYADETAFDYSMLGPEHPQNFAELRRHWPIGKFPLLLDGDTAVAETTPIIEHLQARGGGIAWIPEGEAGRAVRFLDRFFDLYVMTPLQKIVGDALRPAEAKDGYGVEQAHRDLDTAYDWLEQRIGDGWAVGGDFTLADCAAAPSLFYADWVHPIGEARPRLKAYRQRLLGFPPFARAVDEARPYRNLFPLGAPDRD
jgi:glutathione S-transferase